MTRHLVLVLGDQLDATSAAFDGFDPAQDAVWMAEVAGESTHVWSHKARIAVFLAAMRHFRASLEASGRTVHYRELERHARATLAEALAEDLARLCPARLILVEPGDWRVRESLVSAARDAGTPLEIRPDRHFLCSLAEFDGWAARRKELRLEYFYRWMRRRTGLLMIDGQPAGGAWNFDRDNRASFGTAGPGLLAPPRRFAPDPTTLAVLELVEAHFATHPGALAHFDWPVTRADALAALDDFVTTRLAAFGPFQDALWAGEPWLHHSRLSVALNLKLLSPLEVCQAAERAWATGRVPLASAEGFIRQVLGWREYVRGIYWRHMPQYALLNHLGASAPLPDFYWTGDTDMACLADTLRQTLEFGYAHHIQRLMVTGLFALLVGVEPRRVHEWYLAVYVDAVEWVELPNTLGMSQYADGGIMASKPYVATGRYIDRMSNYCDGCRYDPALGSGPSACPFTTLYWDFLARHQERFRGHARLGLQVRNLDRLDESTLGAIREQAERLRLKLAAGQPPAG